MQKFGYRSPRFAVDLPVEYTIEKSSQAGRCIEISKDGITLLDSGQPLPPDGCGTVIITHQGRPLELSMRVVHAGGMEFLYKSDKERKAVDHLIASLSTPSSGHGPVLVS
jgi:hypothetical protein